MPAPLFIPIVRILPLFSLIRFFQSAELSEKSWLSTEETKLFNISKQDPMIEKWIDHRTLK
jgi:hypothetical protein